MKNREEMVQELGEKMSLSMTVLEVNTIISAYILNGLDRLSEDELRAMYDQAFHSEQLH